MTTNGRNRDRLYRLVIALQLGVILLITTAYWGEHRRVRQWNEVGSRLPAEMTGCNGPISISPPQWHTDWCSRASRLSITGPDEFMKIYQEAEEIHTRCITEMFASMDSSLQESDKEREAMDTQFRYADTRARMWEERARLAESRLNRIQTKRERAGSTP